MALHSPDDISPTLQEVLSVQLNPYRNCMMGTVREVLSWFFMEHRHTYFSVAFESTTKALYQLREDLRCLNQH